MKKLFISLTLLLSASLSFSQSVTKMSDTLVYVPLDLMENMIYELEQKDLDQQEMIELQKSYAILESEMKLKAEMLKGANRQITASSMLNDSLMTENVNLQLKHTKRTVQLKRSRNFWFLSTLAGIAATIVVHNHWKYADND